MSTHTRTELSLLSEGFLSLLLTACFGIFCLKTFHPFPWLSFIGAPIGLAIIVACWENKKNRWTVFTIGLLFNAIIWSIVFNWPLFF
ncbi:hypothetical protein [Metabacillus arenae]|uniref:Uncharacterized protein n=1 Tax=Metabacillus arenae TaxID=2771434 RepID=A0A926RVL2_9BACI|nr:hypothetical protein [Metabacillus arenae]MBD1379803.1 hypothetical protein [Metabacillus arenae]